jgi:hypothetical protein
LSPERRLGAALKAVVSEEHEAEPSGTARSVLKNENRRRVFAYLVWHPCATPPEIARALSVSGPTASWHLGKLVAAGYATGPPRGRGRRFWASGMNLTEPEIAALAVLANPRASRIFVEALATPGLTGAQLAAKVGRGSARRDIHDLVGVNLLVAVEDGRFRRYYPGTAASALERTAAKRLREFRKRLLRRLEDDRLSPEVRAAPGDVVEVDVRVGGERRSLRLPRTSLLAGRLGRIN